MPTVHSGEFVPYVPRRVERTSPFDPEPPVDPMHAGVAVDDPPAALAAPPPAMPPARAACDTAACAAAVREEAIRLAGLACARALHEAIARNPLFVARFVDDALRASGQTKHARARLRPVEAAACASAVRCDVVADDGLESGEVVIECDRGTVRASIEERARRLARAAADE